MNVFVRHRYVSALVTAGTLFLIGTITVVNHSAVTPGGTGGLNINGVIQNTNPATQIPGTPEPMRPTPVTVPYTDITATPKNPPPQTPTTQEQNFDWASLVSSLSHPPTQTSGQTETSVSDAYSFVPSGLVSPQKPQMPSTMTASQRTLYNWGTDAGNNVQAYEENHPDQPAILTDFMQDRTNPAKIAAMKQLGSDLEAVGDGIDNLGMGTIPPQMATAGPALANAYREIGRNLAAIPDAQGDDAVVKAILTYDSSAEAFVQKYVNVVLILQANGVTYTQDEPGGVFMFPAN